MRLFVPILATAAAALTHSLAVAAPCQEPRLEALANDHPECRYYIGTRLYREGDHVGARLNWQYVLDSSDDEKNVQRLRTDARNNLGYLFYMGLGTRRDRTKAIQLWEIAARSGQEESSYHLCHALGDARQPEYKPRVALTHCQEALRRYEQYPVSDRDADFEVVVRDIKKYIERLAGT